MTHRVLFRHLTSSLPLLVTLGLCELALATTPVQANSQAESPETEGVEDRASEPAKDRSSELTTERAQKESTSPSSSPTEVKLGMLIFLPPPEDPSPQNSLGAGTRENACSIHSNGPNSEQMPFSIAALVPPPPTVGLTKHEKPTLWLHQPTPFMRTIYLSVREEDTGRFHSQTTIEIPPDRTWFAVELSEEAPPLAPQVIYEWAIVATCGDRPSPGDPNLTTRVRRVVANPSNPSRESTDLTLAQQYASQGLWFDLVKALVQAQQSSHDEYWLTDTWKDLFNYTGLDTTASPPPSFPPSQASSP